MLKASPLTRPLGDNQPALAQHSIHLHSLLRKLESFRLLQDALKLNTAEWCINIGILFFFAVIKGRVSEKYSRSTQHKHKHTFERVEAALGQMRIWRHIPYFRR